MRRASAPSRHMVHVWRTTPPLPPTAIRSPLGVVSARYIQTALWEIPSDAAGEPTGKRKAACATARGPEAGSLLIVHRSSRQSHPCRGLPGDESHRHVSNARSTITVGLALLRWTWT